MTTVPGSDLPKRSRAERPTSTPHVSAVARLKQLDTFDFHGHLAAVFSDERGHWVFPKQLCTFMGIDGESQRKRINRNHWSEGWTATMAVQVPGDTQVREHFLLHQRRLPMWLGSITTSNIRDKTVRDQVQEHQTEFADALADYLTKGAAINPRARQAAVRPRTGAQIVLEMARQLVDQENRVLAVEQAQAVTEAKLEAIEGHHDWFTALAHAKLHDHPTDRAYLSRVGRRATAIMREQGTEPHPRQDATFGQVNVYPVAILTQAFAEVAR